MKKIITILTIVVMVSPVLADWDPGDDYKMHYPQLPDPYGWDVSFTNGPLGDDWKCTQTGPVDDIHMWVSFRGDLEPDPVGAIVGGFVRVDVLLNLHHRPKRGRRLGRKRCSGKTRLKNEHGGENSNQDSHGALSKIFAIAP